MYELRMYHNGQWWLVDQSMWLESVAAFRDLYCANDETIIVKVC